MLQSLPAYSYLWPLYTLVTLYCFLRLIAFFSARKMTFITSPSTFSKRLLEETKLKSMSFTPFWCGLNGHMQGIIYAFSELYEKHMPGCDIKYDTEIFTLKDGGKVALEWYQGRL
jgi:hypothetical protein